MEQATKSIVLQVHNQTASTAAVSLTNDQLAQAAKLNTTERLYENRAAIAQIYAQNEKRADVNQFQVFQALKKCRLMN
jgi:hypothetical protein